MTAVVAFLVVHKILYVMVIMHLNTMQLLEPLHAARHNIIGITAIVLIVAS